ncbi:hypothetical protein, partial [Paraburkholderia caribensis]|uniref:hypothetical protein n=1 Tax=Paraburkholderia caribensis TaxID=75105 RepID=UPI00317DB2F2
YQKGQKIETWIIYLINAVEDLFAAMLLVVILTLIMQYSRKKYAGTDFTFQVSVMAMVSGSLYIISGVLGDYWGYQNYLIIIIVIAVILLFPAFIWKRWAH